LRQSPALDLRKLAGTVLHELNHISLVLICERESLHPGIKRRIQMAADSDTELRVGK
jgi:hypothetical protein